MFKNQSYKSYKENLDFVRSCSNWNELDRLSKNINHKFLSNSKYKSKLSLVEKKMSTILWMKLLPNVAFDIIGHRQSAKTCSKNTHFFIKIVELRSLKF